MKKKKKRRTKDGEAAAKPSAASSQQVASSLNLVTNSASAITQRKLKKKRRALRICEPPSDDASLEKEKQSLLAWVEMCMQPCVDNSRQGPHGGEHFATADRSSNGHTHSFPVCVGNDTSGRICNGDAFLSAHNAHDCRVDHEGQVCGTTSLHFHSNHHIERCCSKVCDAQGFPEGLTLSKHANGSMSNQQSSLRNGNHSVSLSNSNNPHSNKRKREDEKVLNYVLKRSIVLHPSPSRPLANKPKTMKTEVIAWGRNIPVTLTSEACAIQEWLSSQSGNLFGLDVEWRPNRTKGEKNKVALLQLCNESECLIIQMLFLDKKPQALCSFLSDPSKTLAGVGVLADGKRLLHDYGLECQGGIELTTLAVERLKRNELRNVGLKVLVQEVLGLKMEKPKRVTLSNWAKLKLDRAQINYACMDAWASFALSCKLLVDL